MFDIGNRVRSIGIPRRNVFQVKLDNGALETYPLHYLCFPTA